ncbi:MAG: hypothetical protein M3491_12465 [Actinomycetota bacterium]|nr:hypothetical protein [Actinomycetota bacterium]
MRHVGAFGFVVHFDDDERSATYAEQVRVCPACGAGLAHHAAERRGLASGPRLRRPAVSRNPRLRLGAVSIHPTSGK